MKLFSLLLLLPQDEDSEFTLATDFEIGHFFRERIVPRAVLYFTGEALEDDESVSAISPLGTQTRRHHELPLCFALIVP